MPLINGPEMRAAIRVLTRNGVNVLVPNEQVCCGAIHSHLGDLEKARELARSNIDVFLSEKIGIKQVMLQKLCACNKKAGLFLTQNFLTQKFMDFFSSANFIILIFILLPSWRNS